jgi:alcohol/geraniol dehydrogenase (NADP+)
MADKIRAYAASAPKQKLERFDYDPGPLGAEEVEIAVDYCGICHSDLSMLNNEWGMTAYPFVPGHEVAGRIAAVGPHVKGRKIGDVVGLGWFSRTCMTCPQCTGGDQNLCTNDPEQTIVHRHGGFADRVRCHWQSAIPLPAGVDPTAAGPLFCGGVTVFNPILQNNVRPTHRVGVVGIGGLGHLALQFLKYWGCHVVAFSSSDSKRDEAMKLGATEVVNSRDPEAMKKLTASLDFVISTVNVALDWNAILATLGPKGTLHFVGAALEPLPISAMSLIMGQKSLSGTPVGSPGTIATMLDFCARHHIKPMTEVFPMSRVKDALEHLEAGKARYRIVLANDMK